MEIIKFQGRQKEELLRKIGYVFKRRARPSTTYIHKRKVQIKREE